jgi:hypothetical protein
MSLYLVENYSPAKIWLIRLLGLLFFALSIAAAYVTGVDELAPQIDVLNKQKNELKQVINEQKEQYQELNNKLATLRGSAQTDRQTLISMKKILTEVKQEQFATQQQLKFYKSVVKPSGKNKGVNIETISLTSIKSREFHYRLALNKISTNVNAISGNLDLQVHGTLDKERVELSLIHLTEEREKFQKYRFKYFQILQGNLILPASFQPESIKIIVKPNNPKHQTKEKIISWALALDTHHQSTQQGEPAHVGKEKQRLPAQIKNQD